MPRRRRRDGCSLASRSPTLWASRSTGASRTSSESAGSSSWGSWDSPWAASCVPPPPTCRSWSWGGSRRGSGGGGTCTCDRRGGEGAAVGGASRHLGPRSLQRGRGFRGGVDRRGVASQLFGWRVLFAGSLVLALLLIPFARRALPDGNSGGERRFDLAGGLLLGLGAGLLLFGVTRGQGASFSSSAASAASTAFRWSLVTRDSPTSCSVSDSREI